MRRRISKLTRSIIAATLIAVLGIAWLARELDLDVEQLLSFLVSSFGLVLLIIVLAALAAGIIRFLKRRDRLR